MDAQPTKPVAFFPDMTRSVAQAGLRRALADVGIDSAGLDARLITAAALGVSSASLLADPYATVGAEGAARLTQYAAQRLAREPVARIVGEAEFWGLPFRLSPETLVPRPDTEAIVEAALEAIPAGAAARTFLDLGTGSGCILVALLTEYPQAFGLGLDRSPAALATARGNARMNGVGDRAAFVASDWTTAIGGRFDLIVSNPPYIPAPDIPSLQPEVSRFDPIAALDGGRDGLDAYEAILGQAGRYLAPAGRIVLELGHDQADAVTGIATVHGFVVEALRADLAGHPRAMVLVARGGLVSGG